MATLWYMLVAGMLGLYVVFDGFDLGAGAIHRLVARTDAERRQILASIGPVWDGNEVWLLAAGGTLYFAFPALYAASFSGFYLPLMMVLWMLIGRGISLEFHSHLETPIWRSFWDGIFAVSSFLLCVFFGAALGNVIRGVPLDAQGRFFLPLWSDLSLGPPTGILDWYTVTVGVVALLALALHGALWVWLKTRGPVTRRARSLATKLCPVLALATFLVTAMSFRVQPHIPARLEAHPWGLVFPAAAILGLGGMCWFVRWERARVAFGSSVLYLLGMLTSVAFGLYPYVLPGRPEAPLGLTVQAVATSRHGMLIGLSWWLPGMVLVTVYFWFVYRHFAGKVEPEAGRY